MASVEFILAWSFTILWGIIIIWFFLYGFFRISTPAYFNALIVYWFVFGFIYFHSTPGSVKLFIWGTALLGLWPLIGLIRNRRCKIDCRDDVSNGWRVWSEVATIRTSRIYWIFFLLIILVTYLHLRVIWNAPKWDPLFPFMNSKK
jgi:hypothetical protein